jgi:glutathione S-transferase
MVCAEKRVEYRLRPLEFGKDSHRKMHPFLRMPVMRVGDLELYESLAIACYIDEAFEGPRQMPGTPVDRARMLQWISTCNDYLYTDLVQALLKSEDPSDDDLAAARRDLEVVNQQLAKASFLLGDQLWLCDLFLAPMVDYAQEHQAALFAGLDGLAAWRLRMESRSSFQETRQ